MKQYNNVLNVGLYKLHKVGMYKEQVVMG